jgi:hypothetical protein
MKLNLAAISASSDFGHTLENMRYIWGSNSNKKIEKYFRVAAKNSHLDVIFNYLKNVLHFAPTMLTMYYIKIHWR